MESEEGQARQRGGSTYRSALGPRRGELGACRGAAHSAARRTMSRPGRSSRKSTAVPRGAEPSGTGANGQRAARRAMTRRAKPEDLHNILGLSPADQLEQPTTRRSSANPASGEPPSPRERARKKPIPARTGEAPTIAASEAPPVLSTASVLEHEAGSRTSPLMATPPGADAGQAQSSHSDEAAVAPGQVQTGSDPGFPGPDAEVGVPRLYTPEQAAQLLQVPASWLRKRAAADAIAHTRIGRHLRFSTADLRALVHAGQHPPALQPTDSS